jgi:uncharacterized membrane protein YfcA
LGLLLGGAGILGVLVGAHLAFSLSAPVLRRSFAVLLVAAAVLQLRRQT